MIIMSQQKSKGDQKLSSATIVDLKNELYRKRTEFDYQKVSTSSSQITQKKLHEILKQGAEDLRCNKPSSSKQSREKSPEPAIPESEALAKSRAALERKAALYEKLARGERDTSMPSQDDDDEEGYLVDFDRKIVHERRRSPSLTSSPSPQKKPDEDESEWADYNDSRGIKRRCLKSDLEELRNQQKRIRTEDQLAALSKRTDLLSRDDMRELERQRWEAKARSELRTSDDEKEATEDSETGFFESREPIGPLHYSQLTSTETRVHGVGYFAFSADETERHQQMEALNKLHEQTADQRRRAAGVKASREALKNARLAKVLERRQQLSEAVETEPKSEEKLGEGEKTVETSEEIAEASNKTTAVDNTGLTWPSRNQQRDWDRGKNVPGAWQRMQDERRSERSTEFAPPQSYYRK